MLTMNSNPAAAFLDRKLGSREQARATPIRKKLKGNMESKEARVEETV